MVHSPFSNIDYLKLRNAMSTPGGGVSNIEHISFNEIAVRMSRSPGAARVLWTRDRAKGVRNRKRLSCINGPEIGSWHLISIQSSPN
jgi:hypothetical protein